MDFDSSSPWNSLAWSNPSPIQIPSRRFSVRSDRERDATEYARALSSDVTPYAASIISSSDSNSYYRSSRGSRSSIASSLLCPLLDFHDSSRRQSDAGAIMPMRPLPVIHPSPDPLPASNPFSTELDSWNQESFSTAKQSHNGTTMSSSNMSNSASTPGSNLFIPLRRRFLPNIDRTSSTTKPRVETQLFGELLLALEEYVAAFGRRVKVSAPHQFSLGDSAAAVVVAAAAGASTNDSSLSDPTASHLAKTSHDLFSILQNQDTQQTDLQSEPFQRDSPDPLTQSPSESVSDPLDQAPHSNIQSPCKVDRTLLSELCEELEYVTSEVIDVVPAFGEKLMQGHYGPLAVRGRVARANKISSVSTPENTDNQARTGSTRQSTALERFVDYEPGGSQDTSDGGSGWWAERLLRDLLEGVLAETVVKSGSTRILLSAQSDVSSADSITIGRLSSLNSGYGTNEKTGNAVNRKTNTISLGGRSKNWLRIPQSTSLTRSSSISNAKSLSNRNLGFLLIDEEEETTSIQDGKRRSDRTSSKNPFNTRANGDVVLVDPSTSTKQLLAEASQESIFEYPTLPTLLKEQDYTNKATGDQAKKSHESYEARLESKSRSDGSQGSNHGMGGLESKEEKSEMNDEHRQKLLDEGRKRWLAFKANQLDSPPTNHSHSDHRHTINHPINLLNSHHRDDGLFFRDPHMGRHRANSNHSLRNPSNHRYIYNYLANHRS